MLEIKNTSIYTGTILVDGKRVKVISQNFDENGIRSSALGEYVEDKALYYANIKACRADEDAFTKKMRDIEDENIKNMITQEEPINEENV